MITPEQMQQLKAVVPATGAAAPSGNAGGWYSQISSAAPATVSTAPAAPAVLGQDKLGIGQYAGNAIKDQAESGVNQVKQSYDNAKTATNPLEKTEAGMGMLAGGIGAVSAPFVAPVLKPISDITNWLGEKIGNTKAAQDFVQRHPEAAKDLSRITADAGNTAAVLGTAMGGPKAVESSPEIAAGVSNATKQITGTAKTGTNAIKDAITPKPATAKETIAENGKSQANAKGAIDTEMRNIASKYPGVGRLLNESEVTRKTDPISVLAAYSKGDALPAIEKGKISPDKATAFLKKQVGNLSEIKDNLVKTGKDNTPIDTVKSQIDSVIDSNKSWSAAKKASVKADAVKLTDGWKDIYPDGIPNNELDALKTEHAQESKSYNSKSPFSLDAHGVVGRATKQLVEKNGGDAPIEELNKWISSHYDAIKLLNSMRGNAPHGGALSKMMGNTIGEVGGLAGGLAVGHPFIGAMVGRAGAEAVNEVLNSHFISNPLKRTLINNMKGTDPEVVQKALDYLDESGTEPSDKVSSEVGKEEGADASK